MKTHYRLLIVTLLVLSCAITAVWAAPEIIAHRGASYEAPENTLASAKLAWKQNADAVEIDVYLTADHQIAIMHDATTTRTTGVAMKMRTSELADLRKLDAGRWKGLKWAGEKIPTLAEELKLLPPGKKLFVEVKCGAEIVPYLLKAFDDSRVDPKQIVVISFQADVVRDVEKHRPGLRTYYLCSPNPRNVDKLLRVMRVIGTDGVNGGDSAGFNAEVFAKFRQAGFGVYVWTVDNPKVAQRYADLGVDGITTNRPAFMRDALAAPK